MKGKKKNMNFLEEVVSKKKSVLIVALLIALVLTTVYISSTATAYAATVDYWQVKLGDEVIATVTTEADAKGLIDTVNNYYIEEGSNAKLVSVEPGMTAEKLTVKMMDEQPEITVDPKSVVLNLLKGESDQTIYTVQEGDTFWDIAIAHDTDIDTILANNPGMTLENLMPGDEIVFGSVRYLINVTTEQDVTVTKDIYFETKTEETDELYEGEEEVVTEGVNGTRSVTERIQYVNGAQSTVTELSSKIVKEPVTEVIKKGTKVKEEPKEEEYAEEYTSTSSSRSSSSSTSTSSYYSASFGGGSAVAAAALSQLGVTQDCTSLASNSLAAAGIYFHGWPEQYASLGSWTNDPQPGDICIYSGHVAIYVGNGQAVHGGWNGVTTELFSVGINNPFMGYVRVH